MLKLYIQLFADNQDPANEVDSLNQNNDDEVLTQALNSIDELKKNTVSKVDFENLKKQNSILLQKIIDGETKSVDEVPVQKPAFKDLIEKSQKMNGNNTTNLEIIKTNLEIKKHYPKKIKFSHNPRDEKNIIDFWQELVDDSKDDPALFNKLLKERVIYDASLDNEGGKLSNPNN